MIKKSTLILGVTLGLALWGIVFNGVDSLFVYRESAKIRSEKEIILKVRMEVEQYIALFNRVPQTTELQKMYYDQQPFPHNIYYAPVTPHEKQQPAWNLSQSLSENPLITTLESQMPISQASGRLDALNLLGLIGKFVRDSEDSFHKSILRINPDNGRLLVGSVDLRYAVKWDGFSQPPQYLIWCNHNHLDETSFLIATRFIGPILENELLEDARSEISNFIQNQKSAQNIK